MEPRGRELNPLIALLAHLNLAKEWKILHTRLTTFCIRPFKETQP